MCLQATLNMQYLVDALFNIKLLHSKRLHDVAMNFTCEGNNSYSLRKDHRRSGYVDRQILSRNAEIQNPYLQHFQSARSLQSPQRKSKEDRSSDTHRIFRKLSVQAIQRNTRYGMHFGASQRQITLHTGVYYTETENLLRCIRFCAT